MVSSNVNNFPKFWPWHVWDSKMFICLCTWGLLAPHNGISLTGEEAFLKVKSLYEIGDSFSPSHSKERRLGKLIWPILCVLLPFKNHYMLFPLGKSYSRSSHNWININGIKYWNSILNCKHSLSFVLLCLIKQNPIYLHCMQHLLYLTRGMLF